MTTVKDKGLACTSQSFPKSAYGCERVQLCFNPFPQSKEQCLESQRKDQILAPVLAVTSNQCLSLI